MYGVEDVLSERARTALAACDAEDSAARKECLARLAAQWAEEAGGHTIDTLAMRVIHARIVAEAGDPLLCWELLAQIIKDASLLLGSDDELTLRARDVSATYVAAAMAQAREKACAEMAEDIAEKERKSRALIRQEHLRLAADTERVLGPHHPLSLRARRAAMAQAEAVNAEDAGSVVERLVNAQVSVSTAAAPVAPPEALVFPALESFVSDYIAEIFRIDPGRDAHAWCPDWWRHPKAVAHLSAMWESFERKTAAYPETGLESWYRDADLHLAEIRDPIYGAFSGCSATTGHTEATAALLCRPAPAGLLRRPEWCINPDGSGIDDEDDVLGYVFESMEEFVVLYVAQVFQSPPNCIEQAWCPEWWRHPEALARFAGLWRSYERHRALGVLSDWLLYCAGPQLRSLRAPDRGAFAGCSVTSGHNDALIGMPVNPIPAEFMNDEGGRPLFALPVPPASDKG